MTRYLLDTNICIYLIQNHPPEIAEKFDTFRKGEIAISAITWAELCCGIHKDGAEIVRGILSMLDVLPFGIEQGMSYGRLSGPLPNRKANLDRMIAAHALTLQATLVTSEVSNFEIYRPHGLAIENWVTP